MKREPVTINGVAQNGKGGALVKTSDGNVYYIDGLSSWSAEVHNKTVQVTGNLKVETVNEDELKNAQGEWKQGIEGKTNTIHNAKWKIL